MGECTPIATTHSILWIKTSKYTPFCPAGMSYNPAMMGMLLQIHTSPHPLKDSTSITFPSPYRDTCPSAPLCFGSPSLISKPCPNVSSTVPINRFHFNSGWHSGSTGSHVLHPFLLIVWCHRRGAWARNALHFHRIGMRALRVPLARLLDAMFANNFL